MIICRSIHVAATNGVSKWFCKALFSKLKYFYKPIRIELFYSFSFNAIVLYSPSDDYISFSPPTHLCYNILLHDCEDEQKWYFLTSGQITLCGWVPSCLQGWHYGVHKSRRLNILYISSLPWNKKSVFFSGIMSGL